MGLIDIRRRYTAIPGIVCEVAVYLISLKLTDYWVRRSLKNFIGRRMRELLRHIDDKIRCGLRRYVVSAREEKLIAWGMVHSDTSRCFKGTRREDNLTTFPLSDGGVALSDICVHYNGVTFGWIQEMIIYPELQTAHVGHIATDIAFMNQGLGKRLAYTLGACFRNEFGVEEIHFKERSTKIILYKAFFEQKLHAECVNDRHGKAFWIWKIPEHLAATHKLFT
jgi:hypothetical protein